MSSGNSRFSKPSKNMRDWLNSVAAKQRVKRIRVKKPRNAPRLPVEVAD